MFNVAYLYEYHEGIVDEGNILLIGKSIFETIKTRNLEILKNKKLQ